MGRGQGTELQTAPRRSERTPGLDSAQLAQALGLYEYTGTRAALNDDRIAQIAADLASRPETRNYTPASWNKNQFWIGEDGSDSDRSQFYTIGNAINFRFWEASGDGQLHRAGGKIDGEYFGGSMYMWRALKRTHDEGRLPLLDAGYLSNLTPAQFDEIFADDDGANPLRIGGQERITNLRDLGTKLNDRWDGRFLNVARAADGSLTEFAALSAGFRAFDDPVVKLTMVNAIMHSGSQINPFVDEPLAAMDYHLVRHAVRQGIVEPDEPMAHKLREGQFLTTEEAQDLRQACLAAFLKLGEQSGLSGEVVDNLYWLNRNNCGDPPVCTDPATADRCPFESRCAKRTSFGLPLERDTRYY